MKALEPKTNGSNWSRGLPLKKTGWFRDYFRYQFLCSSEPPVAQRGRKVVNMVTLHELKNRVQVADTRVAVPKKAELLEMGVDIVVKELIDTNVEISVFANGYVLYVEGTHSTVFRLHDCDGYDYEFLEGATESVQASFFENEKWYMLPLMIGMKRVETNRRRLITNHKVLSFNVEDSDYMSLKDISMPDVLELMILEETMNEIRNILNDKQLYAVTAYYCDGISQFEISRNLGISQQAASKLIKRTIQVLRDAMAVDAQQMIRKRNKK